MKILFQKATRMLTYIINYTETGTKQFARKFIVLAATFILVTFSSVLLQYALLRSFIISYDVNFIGYLIGCFWLLFSIFIFPVSTGKLSSGHETLAVFFFFKSIWFLLITIPYFLNGKFKYLILFALGIFLSTLSIWMTVIGP